MNLKPVIIVGLWFLLFLQHPVFGQENNPASAPLLTLDQALTLALEHNRQVLNARLEVEKSEQQIKAARKHFLPSFDIKLTESYLLTASDYVFKQGAFGTYTGIGPVPAEETKINSNKNWNTFLSTTLSQPLSQIYRIGLGVEALELGKSVVQEKLLAQRQNIKVEVKRLYYGIIQTQGAVVATREQVEALKDLERLTTDMADQQMVLPSDLLETKARLAKAEYETLSAQNLLMMTKQQLNNLMGRNLDSAFRVQYLPLPSVVNMNILDARGKALERRPEIREARLKRRQAETEIRLKKAEYIPDVSLLLNYMSPFESDFLPKNIASIGLQLTWDFFDWGRKKIELAEKTKTLEQACNDIREVENNTALDVQNRLSKLREAEQLIKASRFGKEAAQEKWRIIMNRFRVKAALHQEVLQAQAALSEANQQYLNAMITYITAKAELEKALGEEL
jgi:outer membrane protein